MRKWNFALFCNSSNTYFLLLICFTMRTMYWYARLSPSTGFFWSAALPSARRERRSKVSDLLMHLVYAAFGLPTLCHNSGASALKLHWIIRSPQRRRLAAAPAATAATAQRINRTLEYKLVERFEIVRFYPIADVFHGEEAHRRYIVITLAAKFLEKRILAFSSISLWGRHF